MKLKYIIITIIVLCVFALMGNDSKKEETKTNTTNSVKINVVSVQKGIELKSYKKSSMGVETILKNNTGKEIRMITIKIECYDKDNNNLGTFKNYEMNINTKDNYKIETYTYSGTTRANVYIEYTE